MSVRPISVFVSLCLFVGHYTDSSFAQATGSDTVSVAAETTTPPKCTASVAMRGVPGFPALVDYRCTDNTVTSVRAFVTIDGILVIIPMRREGSGSFSSSIPVSNQGPTFIAFQQETAEKRVTISDNVPYSPACADPLSFLSEKNSAFGPVAERNMRAALKLGREIDQLNYIKGALDRLSSLVAEKEGK